MTDAAFEDAPFADRPLRLKAETAEDLAVISSLVQDAVCKTSDIHWMPRSRQLVLIVHRFRWEDHEAAAAARRPFERVQSALAFAEVTAMKARGIEQSDAQGVQSLLAITADVAEDGSANITLSFADGAEMLVGVECLDIRLSDLSRPWEAKAKAAPDHPD